MIYPEDSAIRRLNNRDLMESEKKVEGEHGPT